MATDRPRVGISACLLGDAVRYDAGHKRDDDLVTALESRVEFVKVCPEVEAGFGTPRDPMHLAASPPESMPPETARRQVRLIVTTTGEDVTDRLARFSATRVEQLAGANLDGFVFKSSSPSCGVDEVKVFTAAGVFEPSGRGLFAEALTARLPDLPVAEETGLADRSARDAFMGRVFAHWHARGRQGR